MSHIYVIFFCRTTKTGGLPNLAYVYCKPKPLGTEFKCFVDSVLKVMLYVEVQERKVCMSKKSHFSSLGCVMQAVDAGKEFSVFSESQYYETLNKTLSTGGKSAPKEPPSDNEGSKSSSCLSTSIEYLLQKPLSILSENVSQENEEEEDKKVSTNVLCV